MNTHTIPTDSSKRIHPAWWAGGAFALVALGAAGAVGYMQLRAPESAAVAEATMQPAAPPDAPPGASRGAAPNAAPERQAAAPAPAGGNHRAQSGRTTPLDTQATNAAPTCANCGVVQAVAAVQRKGEGTGVGAVVGGVLGGVVGHQMGGGRGKDAMTVIGAVGGGVAGHEVEKRQRANTVYQVKVRMADGSTRTVTQSQSIAVGQPVRVDGQQLTPLAAGPAAPASPRMQQTAGKT